MANQASDKPLQGMNWTLSQVGLALLFLGYWFFVRQLEQVDITRSTIPMVKSFVDVFDKVPVIIYAAEFFTWRVLRHLIPFGVGWWLGRRAILGMVESLYDLEDGEAAKKLVQRLSAVRLGLVRPTPVNLETFEEKRKTDQLLKIGGPGRIMVMAGLVLVTERHGRFCRILGTGRHTLKRFELPRTLLDLRPQEREAENIKMMTSDGIEVSFDNLTITFQIYRGDDKPSKENPFPYDEEAVRKAAYTETNEGNGSVGFWDSLPMIVTRGQLTMIVAEYRLDELIVSDSNGINIHRRLQKEMESRAKAVMRLYGVAIRGTRLGSLELTEPVEKQRKEFWQARWNAQQILQRADGDAEVLQSREIARAEAEAIMLRAIAEGLQRSKLTGSGVSSREIVALRLIESLEEMARKSQEVLPLPEQLIPHLGSLRQQLMITSGETEEKRTSD